MVMLQKVTLMKGEWSCYLNHQFNGGRHGHVTEEVCIMEPEWSCYGGGQFK